MIFLHFFKITIFRSLLSLVNVQQWVFSCWLGILFERFRISECLLMMRLVKWSHYCSPTGSRAGPPAAAAQLNPRCHASKLLAIKSVIFLQLSYWNWAICCFANSPVTCFTQLGAAGLQLSHVFRLWQVSNTEDVGFNLLPREFTLDWIDIPLGSMIYISFLKKV